MSVDIYIYIYIYIHIHIYKFRATYFEQTGIDQRPRWGSREGIGVGVGLREGVWVVVRVGDWVWVAVAEEEGVGVVQWKVRKIVGLEAGVGAGVHSSPLPLLPFPPSSISPPLPSHLHFSPVLFSPLLSSPLFPPFLSSPLLSSLSVSPLLYSPLLFSPLLSYLHLSSSSLPSPLASPCGGMCTV